MRRGQPQGSHPVVSFLRVRQGLHMSENDRDEKTATMLEEYEDEEKPADVVGAKFFGGSAEKEELYDPVEEVQAYSVFLEEQRLSEYQRFQDTNSFPDGLAREFAMTLQTEINDILGSNSVGNSLYAGSNTKWDSPFSAKQSGNPVTELQQAMEFYKQIDIALISAKSLSPDDSRNVQEIELRWEVSLIWPTAWEARVLVTGTSRISLDIASNTIISQEDFLDNGGNDGKDLVRALKPQLSPRFWDLYHIGMTPSAEVSQRLKSDGKGLLSQFELFEIAPRLVLRPTLVDKGGREERAAQGLPNHSFSTIIKTMGPKKQRYTPTSPVEVSIERLGKAEGSQITWTVAVPAEVSKSSVLPIPMDDGSSDQAFCRYEYHPRRKIATLPYGGNPQDVEVTDLRKRLYNAVVQDGLRPKLGADGKPCFFFLQNDSKACFTEDGLGMAVYDWRPKFVNGNEVGIELEFN